MLAWVRGPGTAWKALPCASVGCSVRDVIYRHCEEQEIPVECFFVKCNGVLVAAGDKVCHGAVYSLEPRLRGGKGGFGSMLRALGAQIEKTTNREACRDLSGRRLRDVNHEKAMAEWVKQQAEREAEKEQRRLERLQRKLAEPAHCFASPDYQRQCHEMAERLEDSVLKGMQAASSKVVSAEVTETRKRPNRSKTDQGAGAKKRGAFGWAWKDWRLPRDPVLAVQMTVKMMTMKMLLGPRGLAAVPGKMAVMVGRWQQTLLAVFRAQDLVHALSRLKSFRTP